jgi:hypothetical protein
MTTLLIGFALGILSMAVKSWWADRLRDRRTRRRIARALIPEMQEISYSIWGLGRPIKWDSIEFPPHNWPKHHDELAEAITNPKEWLAISGVFEEVEAIAEAAEQYEWPDELDDFDTRRVEDLYDSVRRALDVLHDYAGVHKPPRRVRSLRRRERLRQRLRSLRLA